MVSRSAGTRSPATSERTGTVRDGGLTAAARTDKGGRPHNEDAFVCRPDLGLFAVIDGMGGQQAGERAAAIAREAVIREQDAVRGLSAANQEVHRLAEQDASLRGMGCVASVLHVDGTGAQVAHVGDTRVYVAGAAGCEQLTRDHTLAARRQEDLGLDERTSRGMGGHNQVTRDIGGQSREADGAWIDRVELPLEIGDLFLLCSDGLHGTVPADELFTRLRNARRDGTAPESLAEGLVDLAIQRGTRDNVTVVVVRADELAPEAAPEAALDEDTGPVDEVKPRRRRTRPTTLLLFLLLAALAAWWFYSDREALALLRQRFSGGW